MNKWVQVPIAVFGTVLLIFVIWGMVRLWQCFAQWWWDCWAVPRPPTPDYHFLPEHYQTSQPPQSFQPIREEGEKSGEDSPV